MKFPNSCSSFIVISSVVLLASAGCDRPIPQDSKQLLRDASQKAKQSKRVVGLDAQIRSSIENQQFHNDQSDYSYQVYSRPRSDGFGFDIGGLRSKARSAGDYAASYHSKQRAREASNKTRDLRKRRFDLVVELTEANLGPSNLTFVDEELPGWRLTITDR